MFNDSKHKRPPAPAEQEHAPSVEYVLEPLEPVTVAAPPVPTTEIKDVAPKPRKPAKQPSGYRRIYDPLVNLFGGVMAMSAAGVLWWIGGILTLTFAKERLGIPVDSMGNWRWLIPAGITGLEVAFWPRATISWNLRWLFFGIASLDLYTSYVGARSWLFERDLVVTLTPNIIASIVIALICAFAPEKLIRSAMEHIVINGKLLARAV